MTRDEQIDIVIDKKEPDEKTVPWKLQRPYPDLARQIAARKGDVAKVESGWEIKGEREIPSWLLSVIRPVGNNLYHYTKIYPTKEFKGATTAHMFMDEANKYFAQMEIEEFKPTTH